MGVYIDMEMPKDGVYWCEIGVADDIAMITIHGEDRKSFPLVPVPEPHGRLIDADKLEEAFCGDCFEDENTMECSAPCMDMRIILEAPTVIPASEEGET